MKSLGLKIILFLLIPSLCFASASRQFDGVNDYVSNVSISGIDNDTMSVIIWFRTTNLTTSATQQNYFMSASEISAGNSALSLTAHSTNGHLRINYRFSGTSGNWDSANDTILINTWYFVGVTYDRSSTTNNPIVYFGSESTTNLSTLTVGSGLTEIDTPVGTEKSGVDTILSGVNVGISSDFEGQIAYLRFWTNKILIREQMDELFRNPLSNIAGQSNVTWTMWGSSPEPDLSGGGNAGSISGTGGLSSLGPPVFLAGGDS